MSKSEEHSSPLFEPSLSNTILSKLDTSYHQDDAQVFAANTDQLFRYIIERICADSQIVFSTLFSKIAFAANVYNIDGNLRYVSHQWRKDIRHQNPNNLDKPTRYHILYQWLKAIDADVQFDIPREVAEIKLQTKQDDSVQYAAYVKFVILQIDFESSHKVMGYTEDEPHLFRFIDLKDEKLTKAIKNNLVNTAHYMQLPVQVGLIDVNITETYLQPTSFVLDPDFMIDVTAVSECFNIDQINTMGYLTRKFIPTEASTPLMLGNIANMMLDQLVYNPELTFQEVASKIFALQPVSISLLDDDNVKSLMTKVRQHYTNLKIAITKHFDDVGIVKENCYVEPTFYGTQYGLQGRLDLLHRDQDASKYEIVELKSGKPFKPNGYGLNHNHYVQTLLYDLIVKHTLPAGVKPNAYILYSSDSEQPLRYAPAVRSQQIEALQVRNTLRIIDTMLFNADNPDMRSIFSMINPDNLSNQWRFLKRDLSALSQMLCQLSPVEYQYFTHFTGMIAREHHCAKIGSNTSEGRSGFAQMWTASDDEKKQQYSSLLDMTIQNIDTEYDVPIISLKRMEVQALTKFRKGDIAVLYPRKVSKYPMATEVFKCTILDITAEEVQVRLRNPQQNLSVFSDYQYWMMDADLIDSSFNGMYQNLYRFLSAPKVWRDLILGLVPPRESDTSYELPDVYQLTANQSAVVNAAITAQDYHLIWGPPGTGKTSKVLSTIVAELRKQSKKILLLSYTNRAVDEICDAITTDTIDKKLLRIGSRYSCRESFEKYLLSAQIDGITKRSELREMLATKDVVISTISSMLGKLDLFKIIDFDVLVVDEASQILEPMIVGVLPRIPKWIFIGDHKQLPAVVSQAEATTEVNNEDLRLRCSLTNTRNSLFERLYQHSIAQGWQHVVSMLHEQGRMHTDIMDYVNAQFYQGTLQPIASLARLIAEHTDILPQQLLYRMVFVPCASNLDFLSKENVFQARAIVDILRCYQQHFEENAIPLTSVSFGIIAPFRSQIALILSHLADQDLRLDIQVDTVERYQGGSKDVVIYSSTINSVHQFNQIVNQDEDGIDRKLNVAITRAKEQFMLLGDTDVLRHNNVYNSLMQACSQVL